MLSVKKHFSSRSEVLKFTYPKLHQGKSWYVDFMSYDPAAEKMRRKKYMLDGIAKVTERRKRAAELIEALTKQLRLGWSPWVNIESNRGYTLLADALDKYSANIERMMKYKSRKTYSSRLSILKEYIASRQLPPKFVYQFDSAFVSDFLDYVYLDREVNARTRNNYRAWCSSLAIFFMERDYIESNPVDRVSVLSEDPKKRQPLTKRMLSALSEYLKENDPYFLLACRMQYYTLIRPGELSSLKLGDINIAEQSVFISAEVSKNRRDGKVGLNDDIIKLMVDLKIFEKTSDHYLFGKDFKPSKKQASSDQFNKRWAQIRKRMKWGEEYQFYSLKDSGIRDLANDQGIVIARDQARHSDVSTTNKYLQGRDMPVHAETKHFNGVL